MTDADADATRRALRTTFRALFALVTAGPRTADDRREVRDDGD